MLDDTKYIVVDLDGTLIRADLFVESIIQLLRSNPFYIVLFLFWLTKGIAYTKAQVARRIDIDVAHLPFEEETLEQLKSLKEQGKILILATASHVSYAEIVSKHLGLFDHLIATDAENNFKGSRKLEAIRELIGDAPFAYAGDSRADEPLWDAANANMMVNAPKNMKQKAEKSGKLKWSSDNKKSNWTSFVFEMRPHQYAKNILIFVPIITAHEYFLAPVLTSGILAFIAFCLCASGVYFLNDLLDVRDDRRHWVKKNRPIASGNLSIGYGILGAIGLPALAFLLAVTFSPIKFVLVLAVYYILTIAYSFFLKKVATVDVMTLAILYTLRILAGAAATGIVLSSWLFAFSVFIFVSLAFMKRYVEVAASPDTGKNVPGRGYSNADSETLFILGVASFIGAVIILALYINSEDIMRQYGSPQTLWLLCLIILFWGCHIWLCARRGQVPDDPVVFAIKDRASRLVGLALVLVVFIGRYLPLRFG
ncbi:MAG: UbiA family prenyltransferase [Proteobacteria bacterium]|nr:UbiA family prenyltransferase [Pseudomonadota bacterium]